MKKSKIIIICIVIALFSGIIGFIVGKNINDNKSNIEGIYYSYKWNNRTGVLKILPDGTFNYPSGGTGTWSIKGSTIHLDMNIDQNKIEFYKQYKLGNLVDGKDRHDAELVNDGIILHGVFFQKMN